MNRNDAAILDQVFGPGSGADATARADTSDPADSRSAPMTHDERAGQRPVLQALRTVR